MQSYNKKTKIVLLLLIMIAFLCFFGSFLLLKRGSEITVFVRPKLLLIGSKKEFGRKAIKTIAFRPNEHFDV